MFWLWLSLGCGAEVIPADGIWEVTIEGDPESDGSNEWTCGEGVSSYRKVYKYEMFQVGSSIELKIKGETYATGEQRGCFLEYQSSIYLEDPDLLAEEDSFRWKIDGEAEVQGAAGGCPDLQNTEFDWLGTEVLTVVDSENETIPMGCTVLMNVAGIYLGTGEEE